MHNAAFVGSLSSASDLHDQFDRFDNVDPRSLDDL